MPSFCVVLNCNDKYGHAGRDISFHKFPFKRKELMTKWLEYAQRGSDWKPSKWSSICSRHFSDEHFSCLNERRTLKKWAVPSVALRTAEEKLSVDGGVPVKVVNETTQQLKSRARNDSECNKVIEEPKKPNGPKRLCRLCGCSSSESVTFASNFEVFGMIQKCLSTLNIQQDDNLPKEVCRVCLQRLESFERFIDGVLEAQRTLQRQFSTEKPNSSGNRASEKPLKIKQEPVVRVKQEAAEVDDSFLSDEMDTTMADDSFCGDQEQPDDTRDIERKFNFGDFPALNTQDIINNCDIMEIINLDDPFINIPDDDGNVATSTTEADAYIASHKSELPSAHELLQAHLIMEEHSYANAAEDLKEEWQIKNSCKTEKNDGYELRGTAEDATHTEQEGEEPQFQQHYDLPALLPIATTTTGPTSTPTITTHMDEHNQRSTRPIVTSVSALADTHPQTRGPHSKPNIVVLNESIVQSASAFQLHACTVCQLRFFSVDSLRQHSVSMHSGGGIPMVSVPHMNIQPEQQPELLPPLATQSVAAPTTCKVEKGCEKEQPPSRFCVNPQISMVETDLSRLYGGHTNISDNTCNWQNYVGGAYAATSQQQHFITAEPLNNHVQNAAGQMMLREQPTHSSGDVEYPQLESHMYLMPMAALADGASVLFKLSQNGSATSKRMRQRDNTGVGGYESNHQRYLELQRRYHRLHRKFLKACAKRKKYRCHLCSRVYQSVAQLVRHKQIRSHFVSKPRHFAANCFGCEKFFRSRLALQNHMRYICQQQRWCKTHLQTFKCRHCRRITFTHWRLYRQHENKCKAKQMRLRHRQRPQRPRQQELVKPKKEVTATVAAVIPACEISGQAKPKPKPPKKRRARKQSPRTCPLCNKVFPSANAFNQHTITHTIGREIKCSLCDRVFKRRHGLMQHLRAFHLQIRPHECPVCQHRFAFKCDMNRCRHSKLRLSGTVLTHTPTPIAAVSPKSI